MKTCVLIPSFNEAKSIGAIVQKVKRLGFEVLVVDDGSTDDTWRIAEKNGARILRNRRNEGKGASLIRGFAYSLTHEFDATVTMDGDGQHSPEEIARFLETLSSQPAGIVIGNRMNERANMPFVRVLTNRFMSWLISRVSGQYIPDTQCGFRLIKKEVLQKVTLSTARYETESQILIRASKAGFKVVSIPITTIYTGSKSRINPWIDTFRFFKFILKEIWTARS